jgi:hypothetical protein
MLGSIYSLCFFAKVRPRKIHCLVPGHEIRRKSFIALVCTVSVQSTLNLLWQAYNVNEIQEPILLESTRARMRRGELPPVCLYSFSLPLFAASAGFPTQLAKIFALSNLVIFLAIVAVLSVKLSILCEMQQPSSAASNRWYILAHDAFVTICVVSMAYFACVPVTEAGDEVMERLRSGQRADSVLNHILKNSMASVATIIEIELAEENRACVPSSLTRSPLQEALFEIHRAMNWISSREVLLSLSAGRYQTTLSPVNIEEFFLSISDRTDFKMCEITRSLSETGCQIAFDEKMARLALENGRTNALIHGDGGPIELSLRFLREGMFSFKC